MISQTGLEIILWFNSLTTGRCDSNFRWSIAKCNFWTYVMDKVHGHFLQNRPQVNAKEHIGWKVNIGTDNGLVPSGTKPLPEPMLIQICVTICHPWATKSQWSGQMLFDNLCSFLLYFSEQDLFWFIISMEPLWKGQECLTRVAKFGPFSCTIL